MLISMMSWTEITNLYFLQTEMLSEIKMKLHIKAENFKVKETRTLFQIKL